MGQTPAKFFAPPLPYGSSPDMGVLQQAKAAPQAPLNNFLPLNPPDPSQAQQQAQQQPAQGQQMQNQLGRRGIFAGGRFMQGNNLNDY